MAEADQEKALRVMEALRRTPVGSRCALVGSSGLFGFRTAIPALTEDIDAVVPAELVEEQGEAIVDALRAQGFRHEAGTATFEGPGGLVFDLLGWDDPSAGDHIAGSGPLRVMVYADLSLVCHAGATRSLSGGGRALSPAGFVVTKLLTERGRKGAKDKLQALLVLAERVDDEAFLAETRRLLVLVDPERRDDAVASAQEAILALSDDPLFRDAGAEGYVEAVGQAQAGFEALLELVGFEFHGS